VEEQLSIPSRMLRGGVDHGRG